MPVRELTQPTDKELKECLKDNDGILSVSMETLLSIIGYQRATANGRNLISEMLEENRIGVLSEIPSSKYEHVRLFDLDLPSGRLCEDLQTPGAEQDERLRELLDHDCRQKLRQIRNIVL